MTVLILVLQIAALVVWIGFLAFYTLTSSWWKSPLGRNISGAALVVIGLLLLIVLQRNFPDYPGRVALQTVVYSAAISVGAQRTAQMITIQNNQRREEAALEEKV